MIVAFILGIVEGLTEFLPISSTGHLIVVGSLLGYTGETAATFEVFIQLGAMLAVVVLYRQRFLSLLKPGAQGFGGMRGIKTLALTTLPAVIAGFVLHGLIKDYLFTPITVAIGLLIGGVVLLGVEKWTKGNAKASLDDISPKQAFSIGLFQTLALWPGVSRSGSTIVGGLLLGLNRKAAIEYSFLAAVPVMLAAVGYDLLKSLPNLSSSDIGMFSVGFVTAFVTALIAIKVFVGLVERFGLRPFGWYRIVIGLTVLVVLSVV